jgi:hypothetical protein
MLPSVLISNNFRGTQQYTQQSVSRNPIMQSNTQKYKYLCSEIFTVLPVSDRPAFYVHTFRFLQRKAFFNYIMRSLMIFNPHG